MKEKKYILGLISVGIIVLGAIFKVNHWPAAGIMITLGTLLILFLFLPLALVSNYRISKNRSYLPLYITTWITCLVVMSAMLFKIQHWPVTGALVMISLPFPFVVFLPVYLYTTSKNKNYNMYNMVFVLLLLAVQSIFGAILALNISKDRIDDSLDFSANYNRVEEVIRPDLLDRDFDSPKIVADIDATLKIVDECQGMLFSVIGITENMWETDPYTTPFLDSKGYASYMMLNSNENAPGLKLERSLDNLMNDLQNIKQNNGLVEFYSSILNYRYTEDIDKSWSANVFSDGYLSWVLIYLDELEVNLLFLKTTLV